VKQASERVIVYRDPLHDDFAGTNIRAIPVDAKFPFVHRSRVWNTAAWLLYYVIAVPIVAAVCKVHLGLRFQNRRALRKVGRTGYFLYGNHTRYLDAFLPSMAAWPRRGYVVASADAVSLPCLKNVTQMLGVIPIPTGFSGMREFLAAVSLRCRQRQCVALFPEAHIWPFYTGIRPFTDVSFRYPVKENVPAVAMVTTYRKRKGLFRLAKAPAMTVTFSEPMWPDASLPPKKAQEELRDRVFAFMEEKAADPGNVAYIRYVPAEEKERV